MKLSRRTLLAAGLIGAGSTYVWQRGLRYPRLSFEPTALSNFVKLKGVTTQLENLIAVDLGLNLFRAYAPEPAIKLASSTKPLTLTINNVSNKAKLAVVSKSFIKLDETVNGIDRLITLEPFKEKIELRWQLPNDTSFRFAVIGDTGANLELDACLNRSLELDADFLLHLGDFNYVDGEYQQAIDKFQNAPLPCFVSIGNHDFRDDGLVYQRFRKQIGPMNNAFTLNGVRFVNLDTAADFFPASAGNRGELLQALAGNPQPQLIFTHRPLKDPRPRDDHEVGGFNEVNWLAKAIKAAGGGIYLNGHVHHSAEFDFMGIRQYTVGEGLGHEDLVLQKKSAKFLIADISPEAQIELNWQALNIPWLSHLSETHLFKLKRDQRHRQLQWYQSLFQ